MSCRSCNSAKLSVILDLGTQPWCNDFLSEERLGKEEKYPLRLCICDTCELLQLDHTVSKETMFGDHQYLSGMTATLIDHFYGIAAECVEQFNLGDGDLIVDIGGNDGSQLLQFKKLGIDSVVNVECASRVSELSQNAGVHTINDYFNFETADQHFGAESVKLFNAAGVFFHLEELHSVVRGIKHTLKRDGVLVIQFMYAGSMIDNNNFDTIYHEHLCYYTLRSLIKLLAPYNLEVFDAHLSPIHSGSVIAKITHIGSPLNIKSARFLSLLEMDRQYTRPSVEKFAQRVEETKNNLREFLIGLKSSGKTIYAYGAPAKGNTLLNYFNIDNTLIDKAVEINELKIGHYLPQSHIPIVKETKEDIPDYYLLLSHNFAEEIIKKNQDVIASGTKFIIPFPTIEVVG